MCVCMCVCVCVYMCVCVCVYSSPNTVKIMDFYINGDVSLFANTKNLYTL